jgi:hypothetical protein
VRTANTHTAFVKPALLVAIGILAMAALYVGSRPLSTERISLNQRRASLSVEDVSLAERKYETAHSETGYACDLSDLGEVGLVDPVLASGTKAGYHFEIRCTERGNQKVTHYAIIATPVNPGTTGKYAVCADESEQIWYSEVGSAADCLETRKPIGPRYR